MSEAKHTPGPWMAREYEDCTWEVTAQGPYGKLNLAEGIDEYDARLIASAPDLLEALEEAVLGLSCIKKDMEGLLSGDLEDPDLFQSILENCAQDLRLCKAAVLKARGAYNKAAVELHGQYAYINEVLA